MPCTKPFASITVPTTPRSRGVPDRYIGVSRTVMVLLDTNEDIVMMVLTSKLVGHTQVQNNRKKTC